MANNLIQIKRSLNTSAPATLANGELAFSANGDVLYVGSNSTVVAIGGKRVPGTLTANQALVANATSYLDAIKVANAALDKIYANGAFGTDGQVLTSNSTGGVFFAPVGAASVALNDLTDVAVTSASAGQVLIANSTGFFRNVSLSGDITVDATGVVSIAADSVVLGTDTTGNYVASITAGDGLSGNVASEGSTPTLAVVAGSGIASNSTGVHVGAGNGLSVNSTAVAVVANSGLSTNATGVFVVAGSGIASNSTGVHVVAGSGIASNSTGVFVVANDGITSNSTGVFVTDGDGLSVNSTGVHVGAGNGLSVNSSAVAVVANNGLSTNATGVFVVAGSGIASNSTGVHVVAGTGVASNSTGVHIGQPVGTTDNVTFNDVIINGNTTLGSATSDVISFNGRVNTSIVPAANVTYDLGSTTLRWKDLYLSGSTINLGNSSLSDAGGSLTLSNTTISDDLTVNGNTVLGSGTSDIVSIKGLVNTSIIPAANITYSLGNNVSRFAEVFSGNVKTTTLTVDTDATINGNLTVSGSLVTINVATLTVVDSLIQLASNNTVSDTLDIGFFGNYQVGGGDSEHAGLFRDATTDTFKLFKGLTVAPTTTIDTGGAGYTKASLEAFFDSGAFVANSTAVTLTANSTVAVTLTANSLTLATALVGTSGGTGLASYTAEDILVANSSNGFRKLALGTDGFVLQSNGTALIYSTLDGGTF